ncbi:hypothetical protein C0J52_15565 [Blattella germanica]|nr:hypothetical protein C0J52_15565 [Blattella germanica]
MVLDKVSRALLVKLFYQNNNNSAAALREYRRIKGIRRGPLSAVALKNMIRKFELTGDLGIAPGRGRRPVTTQIVEEVTVAMAENAGRNLRSSSSARAVSRQLNIPWSTVRKVLRTIDSSSLTSSVVAPALYKGSNVKAGRGSVNANLLEYNSLPTTIFSSSGACLRLLFVAPNKVFSGSRTIPSRVEHETKGGQPHILKLVFISSYTLLHMHYIAVSIMIIAVATDFDVWINQKSKNLN